MRTVAQQMRERLRADLRAALMARCSAEVKVLRSLIAAIDNAEAVPLARTERTADLCALAPREAEAARIELGGDDVKRIIQAEIDERERGAGEYERLGHTARAQALRDEARVARRYTD